MKITCALVVLASAGIVLSGELPTPKSVVDLGEQTRFQETVISDRPLPREIATKLNPKFEIGVTFTSATEPIQLDPHKGAVVAKMKIKGVPDIYEIPDGEYYVWIGWSEEAGGRFVSYIVSKDGARSREILCFEEPLAIEEVLGVDRPHAKTVHTALNAGGLPFPGSHPLPPPPGRDRPPPPRREPPPKPECYKWICVKVCVERDGKTHCSWVKDLVPDD